MTAAAIDLASRPHALYRFYGAGGTLLYIGITADLPTRFHNHRDEKPWWAGVTGITVEHYPDRHSVLEAERRAIVAEKPLYNSQHNNTPPPVTSHRPKLTTTDDRCPACSEPAIFSAQTDRYFHLDGSDNDACWLAILRGHKARPYQLTPVCDGCRKNIPRGQDKGVVHVPMKQTYEHLNAHRKQKEDARRERQEAPGSIRLISARELLRRHSELPKRGLWAVHCDACNPHYSEDTDSWCDGCYWFSVERCRTWAQLITWTTHLSAKDWFGSTNWNRWVDSIARGRNETGLLARKSDTQGADG